MRELLAKTGRCGACGSNSPLGSSKAVFLASFYVLCCFHGSHFSLPCRGDKHVLCMLL